MALINRLFEQRAVSPQTLFRTGLDTLPYTPESGVRVDQDTALTFTAIWACVRLLAGDISTLPLDALRKEADGSRVPVTPQPSWLTMPDGDDPSVTKIDHFAQVAISLLLDGNAFVLCTPSVIEPARLTVLNPRRVQVKKPLNTPVYQIIDINGRAVGEALGPLDLLHVRINAKPGELRGMSPILANQEAIGIGLAAEKYTARFFGSGANMPGFIEMPGEPSQKQLDDMRDALTRRHGGWRRSGAIGFLTGGASYKSTGISPKDSTLTELLGHQLEEAARVYGIPPFMVGSQQPAGVAYASSVERAQHYIDHCLRHYIEPIEAAYSRLVPGDNRLGVRGSNTYVKFNMNALVRGDLSSRNQGYAFAIQNGVLSQNDVRRLEDLPALPDKLGDSYWMPINYSPIGSQPAATDPAATPPADPAQ